MVNKKLIPVLIILLLVIGGWWLYSPADYQEHVLSDGHSGENIDQQASNSTAREQATHSPKGVVGENREKSQPTNVYVSKYGPLPESLKGTSPPMGLQVDENGQLVINSLLNDLFDYFLTAEGEESLETVVGRLEELIDKTLTGEAKEKAKETLADYLAMKSAMLEHESEFAQQLQAEGRKASLEEILMHSRELRLKFLGQEVYDAFYAEQDKMDDYALRKRQIAMDDSLSDEEKTAQMVAAEQMLPTYMQERKQQQRQKETLIKDVEEAKKRGASEEEIYAMRAAVIGAEAADRYRQADRKVSVWDERVDSYRQQRAAILSSSVSEIDKERAISELRESLFDAREQIRITVIDRMKDQQEKP